jgi:hypothetical protein
MNHTLIYDPSCSSVASVKAKVLQNKGTVGYVFDGLIYYKSGNRVLSYEIPKDAVNECFNRNQNDEIETSIYDLIRIFSEKLKDISNYELEILSTNQKIKIPIVKESICIFSVSNRENTNTYFDLCVYNKHSVICYNKRSMTNFSHSGDTYVPDVPSRLLHSIKCSNDGETNEEFYLTVTGYNKIPLHKFSTQTPSVCLVNHVTRTTYIIPCPLDILSMGKDGVFAILAKGCIKGNTFEFTILPKPVVKADVNTGGQSDDVMRALDEASEMNVIGLVPEYSIEEDEEFIMNFNELEIESESLHSIENMVVVQDLYEVPFELRNAECYYFGSTISREDEKSDVVLPIAGCSPVIGDNVLVLAKKPKVENFKNHLLSAKNVFIVVGQEMQNSLIDKCQYKVNAIFIVISKLPLLNEPITKQLDSICINAVTAMAGPCSLVLVLISNRYYFYRGVNWKGFIANSATEYGQDVTRNMENIEILNSLQYPWPTIADMNEVYYNDLPLPISEAENIDYSDYKSLYDLVCQLQVIMSPEALKGILSKILTMLNKKDKEIRTHPQLKEMIALGLFKDVKALIEYQRSVYKNVVTMLHNAVSLKKSSGGKHNIQQLMRKEAIATNVEEATKKSISDLIFEKCTGLGTIACAMDNVTTRYLFSHLKTNTLHNWLQNRETKYLTNVMELCPRICILDGITTSALLENDCDDTSYICPSLSIKNIFHYGSHESIMFLPLQHVKRIDPYTVSWPNEANDPDVALLRIKMRSIIAEAVEDGFSPANKEINYTIIYFYFCILEKLTANVTNIGNEESTVRDISRAIIWAILCAASSGQSPLPLYQIVSYNAPITVPSESIWWMYFKLRTLFKYTGWDETTIDKKFKQFMIKCVRKYVVDPVTSKLRETNSQRRLIENCAMWNKKNHELEWLRTTIPLIQNNEMPPPYNGEKIMRGTEIINKYLRQEAGKSRKEYVLEVCDAIVKKRSRINWKIYVPKDVTGVETIDKRVNLQNLPEKDQFQFGSVMRQIVSVLYENHMDIVRSEELALALLS